MKNKPYCDIIMVANVPSTAIATNETSSEFNFAIESIQEVSEDYYEENAPEMDITAFTQDGIDDSGFGILDSAGITAHPEENGSLSTSNGTLTVHRGTSLIVAAPQVASNETSVIDELHSSNNILMTESEATMVANAFDRQLSQRNGLNQGVPANIRANGRGQLPRNRPFGRGTFGGIHSFRQRLRRVSTAISDVGDNLTHLSATVDECLDPEKTDISDFMVRVLAVFLVMEAFSFLLCLFQELPTLILTAPIALTSMLLMAGTIRLTQASIHGERMLSVMALTIIFIISILSLAIVTRPCSHCLYYWPRDAHNSSLDFTQIGGMGGHGPISNRLVVAWDVQLSPQDDEAGFGFMGSCGTCVSSILVFLRISPFCVAET